jgi:DNA polymerase/3'-5' exonuclease PolX
MFIRDAKEKAERLLEEMAPFCDRIEIGGSIRRGCQIVNDLELVAIPKKFEEPPLDLFGEGKPVVSVPLYQEWAIRQDRRRVMWIKPGTSELIGWPINPLGRYWRALIDGEIKLDLFLTTREQWGAILLIRTGSKEFSQGVMTFAKYYSRFRFNEGALRESSGQAVSTPEEEDVFRMLALDYVEPQDRTGWEKITRQEARIFGSENSYRALLKLKEEALARDDS